jgi:hypothetical protein
MDQETRHGRLEAAHIWADLVSKVLGGVAILVAAWWTYTNFTVERTHDPTMLVTVTPTAHPLRDGHVLLNVDIFLQNIGRVAIKPRFPSAEVSADAGLEISIVEIEPLQDGTAAGTARPAAGDDVRWFDWTAGSGDPRSLVFKRNLLATNDDFRTGRYQLNPGVRYREPFACIVERDRLYAIRARFWTDEGAIADLVYVDTFSVGDVPAANADGGATAVGTNPATRTGS